MPDTRILQTEPEPEPEPKKTETPQKTETQKTETRILLVDDDISLSGLVKDFLQAKGLVVDMHHSAMSAWNEVLKNSYDLILLDWDMPDATGVEFCKMYRDSGGIAPVLMMTGRDTLDDKEEGFESGVDDYVVKPITMRELHARVKSMLRRNSSYLPPPKPAVETFEPGILIAGKYKLERPIGSGGMGIVWLANDVNIDRKVVIKLMHGSMASDDDSRQRFLQESHLLARVKHPNVVTIHDAGLLNDKIPYLVLEHVEGKSLFDLLDEVKRLPIVDALLIMKQLCAGLQEVHNAGIVHRDIKPENILLQSNKTSGSSDFVKLVDFGIARLQDSEHRITQEGMVIGTLDYMSPQQLQGDAVDGRSDIYTLGIILFEMLTGQLPFDAITSEGKVVSTLTEKPLRPSDKICADPELDLIVEKCLEKNPFNRYQTVSELESALTLLL